MIVYNRTNQSVTDPFTLPNKLKNKNQSLIQLKKTKCPLRLILSPGFLSWKSLKLLTGKKREISLIQ